MTEYDGILFGWRVFRLRYAWQLAGSMAIGEPYRDTDLYLCGYRQPWLSNYYEATCHGSKERVTADIINGGGGCGVYGYYMPPSWSELQEDTGNGFKCLALCIFWGTVELCQEGLRATHARIERIYTPGLWQPYLQWMIKTRYQVPTLCLDDQSALVNLPSFYPHDLKEEDYGNHWESRESYFSARAPAYANYC